MQDLALKEAPEIYKIIVVEGGHFYVCGDCTMAEHVYQTLKNIIKMQGSMNETQAEAFMLSLRVSTFEQSFNWNQLQEKCLVLGSESLSRRHIRDHAEDGRDSQQIERECSYPDGIGTLTSKNLCALRLQKAFEGEISFHYYIALRISLLSKFTYQSIYYLKQVGVFVPSNS